MLSLSEFLSSMLISELACVSAVWPLASCRVRWLLPTVGELTGSWVCICWIRQGAAAWLCACILLASALSPPQQSSPSPCWLPLILISPVDLQVSHLWMHLFSDLGGSCMEPSIPFQKASLHPFAEHLGFWQNRSGGGFWGARVLCLRTLNLQLFSDGPLQVCVVFSQKETNALLPVCPQTIILSPAKTSIQRRHL